MLVALVTVLAFAGPRISAALYPPADSIELQLIECGAAGAVVRLSLTNTGERAGAIRGVRVEAPAGFLPKDEPPGPGQRKWTWALERTGPGSIIEASRVSEFVAYSPYVLPDWVAVASKAETKTWILVVELVHSSGQAEERRLPFQAVASREVGTRYPALIPLEATLSRYAQSNPSVDYAVYTETLSEEDVYLELLLRPQPSFGPESRGPEIESIAVGSFVADSFQVAHVLEDGSPAEEYQNRDRFALADEARISVHIPAGTLSGTSGPIPVVFKDLFGDELGHTQTRAIRPRGAPPQPIQAPGGH